MTRDEIMELSPQELNERICESFGTIKHQDGTIADYTKDHNCAFIVVEKMRERGYILEIDIEETFKVAIFKKAIDGGFRYNALIDIAEEPTAPLAICRAALLALELESR
jgi:hypothetical protein